MHAQSLQSCPIPCNSMACSPPASSVHGILQARILESIAKPFLRGSSQPSDRTHISCIFCIAGRFFTTEPPGLLLSCILHCIYVHIHTCIYYSYMVYLKLIGKVSEDYKYPKITTFHENNRTGLVCSWYLVFSLPG